MTGRAIAFFLFIIVGALVSAGLGAGFGVLVSVISPEFARELFFSKAEDIRGYCAAVGMIWGLFLGAGVMGFCLLLAVMFGFVRPKRAPGSPPTANDDRGQPATNAR